MKRTMKKWICLLLSLLMLFSLGSVAMAEVDPVGSAEGKLYTNEALGICVVLPDNWRFLSDAELASNMGYSSEYASREGLATLLEQSSAACTMFAAATDDAAWSMNLMVQDLGIYRQLDEQTIFDLSKGVLTETLTQKGFSNVQLSERTFQLAKKEHPGAVLTGDKNGYQMYMIVAGMKEDRYMGTFTVAALSQEKAEKALSFCYPLDRSATAQTASAGKDDSAAKAAHDKISAALAKKDWEGALTLLQGQYGASYPDYANAVQNCQNHLDYAKAQKAMDNRQFYTAYQLFTALGSFENAAQQARLCIRPVPGTGKLSQNPAYEKGEFRQNLTNKLPGNYNIYVRIYDVSGTTIAYSCFIQPGQTVGLYLPLGTYIYKMAYGTGPWFGEAEMFGDEGIYQDWSYQTFKKINNRKYRYDYTIKEMLGATITREDF